MPNHLSFTNKMVPYKGVNWEKQVEGRWGEI